MATRTTTSWTAGIRRLSGRHRWLTLALAGVLVGAVLVVTGTMTFSAVLSWGVVAAMLLMHLGGHGMHGQHHVEGTEPSDESGHTGHRADADAAAIGGATAAGGTSGADRGDERHRAGGCH